MSNYKIIMKKRKGIFLNFCFILVIGSLVSMQSGCAGGPVRTQQLAPLPDEFCRVAVLPFVNETGYDVGDIIFYRIFTAELLDYGKFNLAREGDVRRIYRQMRIPALGNPVLEQVKMLAERLEVDLLIGGRIIFMADGKQGGRHTPSIAVSLRMIDGNTGRELVSTFHKRDGEEFRKIMQFGLVHSMTGLARRVSEEILEKWEKKGLLRCENG